MKSTSDEIRQRFDREVERFANLETGHAAMVDGALVLELVTQTAAVTTPHATHLLDIGCGAGNYSLILLHALPDLDITLVDLSRPMLDRAYQRLAPNPSGSVTALQADIRQLDLGVDQFDIILAAAVFHHLRAETEWQAVFTKCYNALRSGGSLWIADLLAHDLAAVQALMWTRYGDYLTNMRDAVYRDQVFAYIEREDSPRSLLFQIDLLRQVGFHNIEILHKHSCFAAFGGLK